MTSIADNHVVDFKYTVKNQSGEIIDSSDNAGPLSYIHGQNKMIPGLEREISGKKIGDIFQVTVKPEDAYGHHDEAMTQAIPKSEFGPDVDKIQVGSQLQVQDQDGQARVVVATEIRDDAIVLDANHPLAGQTLHFDVEIVGVRQATSEELAEGQING